MKEIRVLDMGFVRLVDVMGDDSSIVQAARVSYGAGTKTAREDSKLIGYLMRNEHMSPFEMAELKFHVKAPIFVARQWVRHRMASWNEVSARYSEVRDQFYLPELDLIARQSETDKQGRGEALDTGVAIDARDRLLSNSIEAYRTYRTLLSLGVARELARMALPVNFYTEWYWKIDLRNYLHFLDLRDHPHAQHEIREYARASFLLVQELFPVTFDAWKGCR